MENLAKLQKLNLEMSNLDEEESRIKNLQIKLQNALDTLDSDLQREKSISLDASLNEKRILGEKNELLKTEKEISDTELKSEKDLNQSKSGLQKFQDQLDQIINEIESYIDSNKKLTRDLFKKLKHTVNQITTSQEQYASTYGKNESIKSDSIKRRERIKSIDIELENWKNLKTNSDKMLEELNERKSKIKSEIKENQKNPEKIATTKGQNIQNIENTKKRSEELDEELTKAETKYNLISQNLKEIQEKFSILRENKARSEATIEGIDKRKKDLVYSIKNDLKLDTENNLLSVSNLNTLLPENYPSLQKQELNLEKIKKKREALGSVNLKADEETKKYQDEIKKMQDDRADLYSAIVKLKASIDELNQKGREKLLDAYVKVNRKFNEVYTKLFNGGSAKLELVDSDDPLEAGLEMLVSPPGKRLQSITLLSGGEQALTALSLIFAVFLVNPSPICVLDEVDAPLDDANVTKFCSLLDELTKITQTKFIIISHHALTMSRMHRLYGVTMAEKGVSQLVAVDLEKAEELVA
jgi:chromosome segregation protein